MNNKSNIGVARWLSLIIGIFVVICGIILIFTPFRVAVMSALFLPIAILFHGISCVAEYFSAKKERPASGWLITDGILSIIIGLWMLFSPVVAVVTLPYIFGFWVLFAGILRVIGAITGRSIIKGWGWLLFMGIIGVLSGVFLINHPLFADMILGYLISWAFIFMGIQDIAYFFSNKNMAEAAPEGETANVPAGGTISTPVIETVNAPAAEAVSAPSSEAISVPTGETGDKNI